MLGGSLNLPDFLDKIRALFPQNYGNIHQPLEQQAGMLNPEFLWSLSSDLRAPGNPNKERNKESLCEKVTRMDIELFLQGLLRAQQSTASFLPFCWHTDTPAQSHLLDANSNISLNVALRFFPC